MAEDSVKNRLISFIKYKRLTKTAFGESIGVSNAFVTSIRRSIAPDKVQSIASTYPELSIDWLLYGKGEMLLEANPENVGYHMATTPHDSPDNIAGMIELQKGYQEILKKSQQQIDRLIGIIEKGGKCDE